MFFVSDTLDEWQRFADWLNQQLAEKHLSIRALARKAGISHTVIARMSNAEGTFTIQSLNAVADALDVPRELVQEIVGLLPDYGEIMPEAKAWSARLMALPADVRALAVQAMEGTLRLAEGRGPSGRG